MLSLKFPPSTMICFTFCPSSQILFHSKQKQNAQSESRSCIQSHKHVWKYIYQTGTFRKLRLGTNSLLCSHMVENPGFLLVWYRLSFRPELSHSTYKLNPENGIRFQNYKWESPVEPAACYSGDHVLFQHSGQQGSGQTKDASGKWINMKVSSPTIALSSWYPAFENEHPM